MEVYDYDLPNERIAKYPLEQRDASKLLVYNHGTITDDHFGNLVNHLPQRSLLVRNDTKVIRARLKFAKTTGAIIEVFCLEPLEPSEVEMAFTVTRHAVWKCIVGNSKRWKEGPLTLEVSTPRGAVTLSATRLSIEDNTSHVAFDWQWTDASNTEPDATFAEVIEAAGVMPIPPYLNRETEPIDNTRYQTVYSCHKGSVAAPTAGLHFTPQVLEQVEAAGHTIANVTLHVGAGTFKPVTTDKAEDHVMHTEHIVVTREVIAQLRNKLAINEQKGKPTGKDLVVAVGTTSVRTLESLFWLGVKLLDNQSIEDGLAQWDAYHLPQHIAATEALGALLNYLDNNNMAELHNQTQIMIIPGYKFRIVGALITNFHQPHSTLLLLIGAFVGDNWRQIYKHALDNGYRFLSYGDSSLLMP